MWLEHGNAYFQSFFVADNLERFTTERFNDARPFWFYLPVLLGGLMPWSVYLVAFCVDASRRRLRRRTLRLDDGDWRLLLWAVMPLLFFTISIGKQPRYILPVLPPLAVFVARGIVERTRTRTRPSAVPQPRGSPRRLCACSPCCSCAWSRCFINAYPRRRGSPCVCSAARRSRSPASRRPRRGESCQSCRASPASLVLVSRSSAHWPAVVPRRWNRWRR